MFVYGVCAGPSDKLERIAMPGIRVANPDAAVLVRRGESSIHIAYNSLLDEALRTPGLEGVILVHDDTAIEDPDIEAKLRELRGEVDSVGESSRSIVGVVVVGVVVAVIAATYLLGKRKGRRRTTVVEVRRI